MCRPSWNGPRPTSRNSPNCSAADPPASHRPGPEGVRAFRTKFEDQHLSPRDLRVVAGADTPTPDPSPQGGGELGARQLPLPLVGRGQGWGYLRRRTSPTENRASEP